LAKFFFCVVMDRDVVEVHKLAKKERGQYPAILTEQTWGAFVWDIPEYEYIPEFIPAILLLGAE